MTARIGDGRTLGPLAALVILAPWAEAGGVSSVALWLDLALHLMAWVLVVVAFTRTGGPGGRAVLVWLAPALVVAGVSALRAPYGYAAWLTLFELITALALLAACVRSLGRSPGPARRQLATICVVAALPSALLALVQFLSGHRGGGAFVNPNHLGGWLAAMVPLCLVLVVVPGGDRWARRGGWVALATIGSGVLASGSRAALLALLIVAVLTGLVVGQRLSRRVRRALVAGTAGFALLAVAAVSVRFADGTDIYRYDRLRIWPHSLEMLRDAPLLGVGPGQFPHRAARHTFPREDGAVRYGRTFRSPHSHALLWLIENGVIGLLVLAIGVGGVLRGALRGWRRAAPEHPAERPFAAGAGAGLLVLAIVSLVDEPLARPPLLLAAAVLAALALPAPGPRRRVLPPGSPVWVFTAAAALFIGGSVIPAVSSRIAAPTDPPLDPAGRVAALERAARVNPWQAFYPGEAAAIMLEHAAHPLDLASYARIRASIDRAIDRAPGIAGFRVTRARLERRACVELLRDEATCERAAAGYREALAADPLDARIAREAASYAALMERYDVAEQRLRQALELEPAYLAAWRDLIHVQRLAGDREGARDASSRLAAARRDVARRVPDSPYARAILDPGDESGPAGRSVRDGG